MSWRNPFNQPRGTFYILALYVFLSFIWWSYLLLDKNWEAFEDKIMLRKLEYNVRKQLPLDSEVYLSTPEYQEIDSKFNRQKWMILSEGAVFLFLLSMGVFYLWRSFSREIELATQQNNFLLSITHELKSPLASIKLSLQTFLKRLQLEDNFKKLLNNSLDDVDRLDSLVENILLAAKIEGSSVAFHKQEENFSEIVQDIVEKVKFNYEDTFDLHSQIEENICLTADKMAMSSAITNLIDNAIKYSDEGTKIDISLKREGQTAILSIKDEGIGIPGKERKNVFKKFYRVGNEETRKSKGTGLGLFIVKKVVDFHEGKINVSPNTPKGTIIRISFPINTGLV